MVSTAKIRPVCPTGRSGCERNRYHSRSLLSLAARHVKIGHGAYDVCSDRADLHSLLAATRHKSRGVLVGMTTMLVSTLAGSIPAASAMIRAWAWSSASRSMWWSRA